jgi:hypothetical protein
LDAFHTFCGIQVCALVGRLDWRGPCVVLRRFLNVDRVTTRGTGHSKWLVRMVKKQKFAGLMRHDLGRDDQPEATRKLEAALEPR